MYLELYKQTHRILYNMEVNIMANFYDFSSDKIDIYMFLVDKSGSMSPDTENVKKGLEGYKESFESFPDVNSISVSVSQFNGDVYLNDFTKISQMDIRYGANGATAIYYAICEGAKHLLKYIESVTEKTGVTPKATFIVFSDGEPCQDRKSRSDAEKAISKLNYAGVTTVFVAFGSAINSSFGNKLGFMSTKDVENKEVIVEFLSEELSKSCKEQSKSYKALGANFFSQAANSSSKGYSQATAQVLEDDSWINDI